MIAAADAIAYGTGDPGSERIVDRGRIPGTRSGQFGPSRGDFGVDSLIVPNSRASSSWRQPCR